MIEVLEYIQVHDKKSVVGYATVFVPKLGIIFRRCTHVKSGSGEWVTLPRFKDADETWKAFSGFKNPEHHKKFEEELRKVVKAYIETRYPVKEEGKSPEYSDQSNLPF